jgi:predicted transcriptional regulator of viral defense system
MSKTSELRKLLMGGMVSTRSLRSAGIPEGLLHALVKRGEAVRVMRGVYTAVAADFTETVDYETLAAAVPQGVFCLFSALRLHDLTDENPHELFMALRHGSHAPVLRNAHTHFIFRTEPVFSSAIETRHIHGIAIRVYTLEQTLADCFQHRSRVGLDVAIAALRQAFQQNRVDRNELWEAASRCRVTRVMEPYLEALS